MSRNQKIKALMTGCALIAAAAVILAVSGIFPGGIGYSYADAEKYTAGEAEIQETVRNLEVDWIDGAVEIEYHKEETVLLRETSKKTIADNMKMRWWMDGDTLRIKYSQPGLHLFTNLDKKLTITLPEGIELNEVTMSASSGDLIVPGMKAKSLKLDTSSGNIRAEAEAKTLRASSSSGSQQLKAAGEAKEIRISTSSGGAALAAESAEKLEAGTSSGGLAVTVRGKADEISLHSTSGGIAAEVNEAGKLTAECSSGGIALKVMKAGEVKAKSSSGSVTAAAGAFEKMDVSASSGDVTAVLPEEPGFTAEIRTSSGSLENQIALAGTKDQYVCGDGSAQAKISTSSGDIRIEPWKE